MMEITSSRQVAADPSEVLSAVLDNTVNTPDTTMTPVIETEDVAGTVYEWTFRLAGVPLHGVMVITEYVPDERLSLRNFGALESTATMLFEPKDGGTRVTVRVRSRLRVPLVGRFVDGMLRRGVQDNLEWVLRQVEVRHAAEVAAS